MARVTAFWESDEAESPSEVLVSCTVREWAQQREAVRVELARMGPDRASAPTTRERLDALGRLLPLHVTDGRLRDWLATEAGQRARVVVTAYTPPPSPDPRSLLPALNQLSAALGQLAAYRAAVRGWPALESMAEGDAYDAESRREFVGEMGRVLAEWHVLERRVRMLLGNPTATRAPSPQTPQPSPPPGRSAAGGSRARRGATPR